MITIAMLFIITLIFTLIAYFLHPYYLKFKLKNIPDDNLNKEIRQDVLRFYIFVDFLVIGEGILYHIHEKGDLSFLVASLILIPFFHILGAFRLTDEGISRYERIKFRKELDEQEAKEKEEIEGEETVVEEIEGEETGSEEITV